MGPGFLIFFDSTPNPSSGGFYNRTFSDLEPYEERVKKALKRAEKEKREEIAALKIKLVEIEIQREEKARKLEIKAKQELEFRELMLKEALTQVQAELARLKQLEQETLRLAKILKDDDEVIAILYS